MHICKFFFQKKAMHPQEVVAHLSLQCCFKVQTLKDVTEGVKIRVRGQDTGWLVAPVHQCKLNPASTHSAQMFYMRLEKVSIIHTKHSALFGIPSLYCWVWRLLEADPKKISECEAIWLIQFAFEYSGKVQ